MIVDGEIYHNGFDHVTEDYYYILGHAYIRGLLNKKKKGNQKKEYITYYSDEG